MSAKRYYLILISLILFSSCGKNGTAVTGSDASTPFTSAIGLISSGVAAAGGGLRTGAFSPMAMVTTTQINAEIEAAYSLVTPMVAALCDTNGMPVESVGGAQISQADYRYPFIHTYCAMTINGGDTVRGGFDIVKGLICSLEKGGIAFAGVAQAITINFADTSCWPSGGPGGATSGTLNATGTTPAVFNTHFDKGVSFTYVDGADTLTYKVAANITTNSIEFIAHESWSNGNIGVMAGSLNKITGALLFEKRDERIRSGCSTGSCGWNRHTRIGAVLTMAAGEPSGLTSLSYGYSDIQVSSAALASPSVVATSGGKVITASGTLTGGIKSRIFATTDNARTVNQMKLSANWGEVVGTGCMTGAAGINNAANCTGNAGLPNFSADNTKFTLLSTSAQLSPSVWLAAFSGFTFTAVDIDVDQAY
jgi:hypothetical protein